MQNEDRGTLLVRVCFAGGAYPVSGAQVFISTPEGEIVAACAADESGLAGPFELGTEPLGDQEVGEAVPCRKYAVEVIAKGFETAYYPDVAVYCGIESVKRADMIPLPGGGAV